MPRNARKNSMNDSKIYHVILKGINSQEIFLEDNDRRKFLKELKNTELLFHHEIFAYVLMTNHVHLIVYDKNNELSQIMHRICTIYAIYFNKKYERIGHLFQNRFKSKCANSDRYLLSLQKYIHRNPEKDGICKASQYKWSSYQEYIHGEKIAKTGFILELLSNDREKAIQKFIEYNGCVSLQNTAEFEMTDYLTDEEAIEFIKKRLKINNVMSIQNYSNKIKQECIKNICEIKGISKKQISRILGINIRTIQRAITGK